MKSQNQNNENQKNKGIKNRSDMRKHQYKNHDEVLTNDENYDLDTQKFIGEEPSFEDKLNNVDKSENSSTTKE